MSLHHEISFETEICEHLAAYGWLYAEGDASRYDRSRAMFPPDLVDWVKTTQPDAWNALSKHHGAAAEASLIDRVRKQVEQSGVLDVLRNGVGGYPLKKQLALAQFKPAFTMNADLMARYQANRLRIVRQVRYSSANENSIDLVLFLNGLPVATCELKTDFTQSVQDAVDQYRFDRNPKPKGQAAEPLLAFPNGALVHFAVSNSEVRMTTQLKGPDTVFLPFNKGHNGAAGNPPNAHGHPTSYLWEEVWQRESWLDIIGRYIVATKNSKQQVKKLIFPRFHQLDVTRKLQESILVEGAGTKFLIQHSAGSGKTNSIAWAAHFLADLHDADNSKVFSAVIVVSDRNVIDSQLREALVDFQRNNGVVATITNKHGSKSSQLAQALAEGKKIIVCTIQTFPFAYEEVQKLAATEGKTFAVIADEAHSSQTGSAASDLKKVLSPEEIEALKDEGEISAEDVMAAQMSARAAPKGISFIAFTATPKAKTLQLFGRPANPDAPAGPTNLPAPFHVYSMRQAIEEGFILDVLKNYTPYKLAFRLASGGKEWDETEVERSAAMQGIMGWVRLHPYNISQKVQIVVEHFREKVAPLLDGKAKAMVVLASRKEAVRWQLAITKYIKSKGYRIGALVAFSGEVNDPESGPDPFTENSVALNPNLKGRDIRKAFEGEDYHLLLVANKFQTGFDQPLLCGMYVDRRLAGIQAVQTLSRLNRAHPGKDTTYVVDFVNSSEEVLEAFKTYYETAELESVTDPNLIHDLRAKLDRCGHYDDHEVERVVRIEFDTRSKQGDLIAAMSPVADRLLRSFRAASERRKQALAANDAHAAEEAKGEIEALLLFKNDCAAYVRLYAFLSQIFDYGNTDIEKRFIFYRRLVPLLEFGREREGVDVSSLVLTHHNLRSEGQRKLSPGEGEAPKIAPASETGSGMVQDKDKVLLAEIIAKVNDLFEGDLSDDDKLVYVNHVLKGKLLESEELVTQAANNSKEQFSDSPDLKNAIQSAVIDALAAHQAMSTQALDAKVQERLREILLGPAQLWEALRGRADIRQSV